MVSLNCFCSPWSKKKDKGDNKSVKPADDAKNVKKLHIKVEHLQKSSETTEVRSASFSLPVPFRIPVNSRCKVKVMNHDSPVAADSFEVDYEGGDEHDETLSTKMDFDFYSQARLKNSNEEKCIDVDDDVHDKMRSNSTEEVLEMITSGHVSDPGTGKAEFWASPKLKRSCSNLAMRNMCQELDDQVPLSKCRSYEEMQRLTEMYGEDIFVGDGTSPLSVRTHCSADKVMLKKHSSSQILPSRSRRLWWKLFLWSHRNLHRAGMAKPQPIEVQHSVLNPHGGYSSDTLEPRQAMESRKLRSPASLAGESIDKGKNWDGFYGLSGMWPQNQWVALPSNSSPFARVNEWVNEVLTQPPYEVANADHTEDDILFPPSPARSSSHVARYPATNTPEEILHANTVIRSLNSNSTVAHITGIGLKAMPSISHLSSLRSVNLSGNFIVHVTPGSLPKGLHVLNLSRNKINTIEGLRELTRLRVLDLSYNRISRIGQGLSNCTLIKELYLAGNKISNVEGLHRLLKLTVLDLSFNKITTAKALGQLVANYNTLIAVNLLGNPIQSNINDEQLRKTVCSLLPKLALLNKQPVNHQKAREILSDANAKAALGSSSWSARRKAAKRAVNHGTSSSRSVRRSSVNAAQKTKQRSKNRSRHHPALKDKA
ncbi:U2-associated snRNP A' protein [Handroanthus impetiginosus]|uniref:U2-associated snRNP A' protein n=1 Tax=Handroanthus impetiginosus TaxID=429701 RepID=A0A2G9GZL0_9LAMI|nr:U2-associated snRNP A' protein [Handroanthus impetiginosus]